MIYYDIPQNTDEWFELRKGKFTASTFKSLFATGTTKEYEKAIYKVVFERITGQQVESEYQSAYMKRGLELEAEALKKYSLITFNEVSNGGFFEFNEWIGGSPDGLIEDIGLVQAKCPAFNTMINYLLKNELPNDYFWQIHGELYVTGRQWCDFFAYHPNLKPVIIRVNRDEEVIKKLDKKLKDSIKSVKLLIAEINKK